MHPDLSELHRKTQENLVSFLRNEIKLATTFCKTFELTEDDEHKATLLENVTKAIDTVQIFQQGITDDTVREELLNQADKLDKLKHFLATQLPSV